MYKGNEQLLMIYSLNSTIKPIQACHFHDFDEKIFYMHMQSISAVQNTHFVSQIKIYTCIWWKELKDCDWSKFLYSEEYSLQVKYKSMWFLRILINSGSIWIYIS